MRESAREREENGWGRYMRVAARYFYWPRLSEGSLGPKKKKKETNPRVAKQAGNEEVRENEGTGRASSESIR